jgi:hypothetical protein
MVTQNAELTQDESSEQRNLWQRRARLALNRWFLHGPEESIAREMHEAFRDGVRLAAGIVERNGHTSLGVELRKLADRG